MINLSPSSASSPSIPSFLPSLLDSDNQIITLLQKAICQSSSVCRVSKRANEPRKREDGRTRTTHQRDVSKRQMKTAAMWRNLLCAAALTNCYSLSAWQAGRQTAECFSKLKEEMQNLTRMRLRCWPTCRFYTTHANPQKSLVLVYGLLPCKASARARASLPSIFETPSSGYSSPGGTRFLGQSLFANMS